MSSPAASVSIVIPSHNRVRALQQTLSDLAALEAPDGASCEVLVIANGCTDLTPNVVRQIAATYPFELRCVEEAEGSLNLARNRGAEEAGGEIIAFLDDDVTVDRNWLTALVEAFDSHPADVVAGRVTLAWEAMVPSWVGAGVEQLLSKLDLGDSVLELDSPRLVGANFAVRRSIALEFPFRLDLDRAGRHLLSGGDTEFTARALAANYRLFYVPHVAVAHRIPAERLDVRYLSRLAYGRGLTRVLIGRDSGRFALGSACRLGISQAARGLLDESAARLRGSRRDAVAARLLWMRGLGTIAGVVSAL